MDQEPWSWLSLTTDADMQLVEQEQWLTEDVVKDRYNKNKKTTGPSRQAKTMKRASGTGSRREIG